MILLKPVQRFPVQTWPRLLSATDKITDPNPAGCHKQGALPTALTKWAHYPVRGVQTTTRWNGGMEERDDCLVMMLP